MLARSDVSQVDKRLRKTMPAWASW